MVEVFKTLFQTDFLVENKFQQNILHIVLKAGYYNKVSSIYYVDCRYMKKSRILVADLSFVNRRIVD